MIHIPQEDYSKYFFVLFVILFAGLAILVVWPFTAALLTSAVLAYLFYPLYTWVKKKSKSENLASLLLSVFVVILLLLPLFFVINTVTREAYVGYLTSKQKLSNIGDMLKNCNPADNAFCSPINYLGDFLNEPKVKYHLQNTIERVSSYIVTSASGIVLSIPRFVLNFFVMIFAMFYLFKDGPYIAGDLKRLLPLKDIYKRHLFERFGEVIHAVVYGYAVIAMVQGILGIIGFFIFGVPSPLIWGIVMTFAAFIPFIGTWIIWLPAALFKLMGGISSGSTSETTGGILFILYGMIIISGVDNIIRPKIIGDKAKIHPILILVGVLGGLYLLGFIGAVIGPLILALFIAFVKVYEKDRKSVK